MQQTVAGDSKRLEAPRGRGLRDRRSDIAYAAFFLAPQVIGLIAFVLVPLVFALYLSTQRWDGLSPMTWVGLDNLRAVFSDPDIGQAAANTLLLTVLLVPSLMLSGLAAAFFLQKVGHLRGFYRALFFAPQVISTVAVAAIWLWLFNPDISPVNGFLRELGITAPNWLNDDRTVLISFAIVGLWQGLGYQVVMFAAGLENIPRTFLEAAELDGASEWQKLRTVTIPLLSPTILFLSTTSIIWSFQLFDYMYVFYGDVAPRSGRTIVYEIVEIAFRQFDYGRASALALCLFVALVAITGLQLLAQKKWVHYADE